MRIFLLTVLSLLLNGLLSVSSARLKCRTVSIANGSSKIRSKGRLIVYKCDRGFYMLGDAYAACIRGKWDLNPPVCLRPGCPAIKYMVNGHIHDSWRSSLLKFTCNPGYKLVGPSLIYCNGKRWNAMQPYCRAVDINCDFENTTTCNWGIDGYDDEDFNWRLQQHEPPSRVLKTGPLHDHTLSPNDTGHYLVLETSDYTSSSKPARIHSPVFPQPSDNSSCFIFWYHMFGSTIGTLNIFLNNVLVFQRQGNHGDRWIKGIVSLSENISSSELQLIIEGSYGGGYTGDIGLDDFSIRNGTDCISSTVTSCVGRCYEDQKDESFCLCNPECLTDSSCCKDFVEACSFESTTPYYEASTGVEDRTQVYSNTPGTAVTEYDINLSETHISTTSELEITDTTDFQYTDSTNPGTYTSIDDSNPTLFKLNATQTIKEEYKYRSSDNNVMSSSIANNSAYHSNVSISSLEIERQSTEPNNETSATNRVFSSSTVTFPVPNLHVMNQSILTDYSNIATKNVTRNMMVGPTVKPFVQQLKANTEGATAALNVHKLVTESSHYSDKTTTPYIAKKVFTKSSSFSIFSTGDNSVVPDGTITMVPFNATELTFKNFTLNKNLTKPMVISHNMIPSVLVSSTISQTTVPTNATLKFVAMNKSVASFMDKSPIPTVALTLKSTTPLSSSTKVVFKSFRSTSPPFKNQTHPFYNISTVLPHFHGLITSTPKHVDNNVSKADNNKVNNSHTHLQTTSPLPYLIHTTSKKSALVTSIETSTAQINHLTISPTKKWKSIYQPKGRFMFSAVHRNESSGNKTFIALSASIVSIVVISALLVILILRRRRYRLVNELEEADTDILYHSSQEMLDLHIARPNH